MRLYTTKEVAALLGVDHRELSQMVNNRRMRPAVMGRRGRGGDTRFDDYHLAWLGDYFRHRKAMWAAAKALRLYDPATHPHDEYQSV